MLSQKVDLISCLRSKSSHTLLLQLQLASTGNLPAVQSHSSTIIHLEESRQLKGFVLSIAAHTFAISRLGDRGTQVFVSRVGEATYTAGGWSPTRPGQSIISPTLNSTCYPQRHLKRQGKLSCILQNRTECRKGVLN